MNDPMGESTQETGFLRLREAGMGMDCYLPHLHSIVCMHVRTTDATGLKS